jgi:hypothetical protein
VYLALRHVPSTHLCAFVALVTNPVQRWGPVSRLARRLANFSTVTEWAGGTSRLKAAVITHVAGLVLFANSCFKQPVVFVLTVCVSMGSEVSSMLPGAPLS